MSSFHGGPADGLTLSFRSAPLFLRLVFNPRAKNQPWDGLDQPQDVAKPHEQLHAYVRTNEPFYYHASYRFKGKRNSGMHLTADYSYVLEQPSDEIMRDVTRWNAWCAEQPIGERRAEKLETHLKDMGVLEPLTFIRTWCRWTHSSLAELSEAEGKTLIAEAANAVKILKANPKQYEVPNRPPDKTCEACGAALWFVKTANSKHLPITAQGYSHYLDCTNPEQFSRRQSATTAQAEENTL